MFQLICKKIPLWRRPAAFNLPQSNQHLCFLQLHHFSISSEFLIPKSSQSNEDSDRRLFIINYLTNTCGMSQKAAESSSKYLTFNTLKTPDSVISFFNQQGFTGKQISCLIRRYPVILSFNPDKNLLPKLDFFRSIGLSTKDIAVKISGASEILGRSLEKQIIPVFRYISSLLQSNEKEVECVKHYIKILMLDLEDLKQNVGYLGEVGVPHEKVVMFVKNYPHAISCKPDQFRKVVDGVKSMGLDPLMSSFFATVCAFGSNSECLWKKKVEIYKSYGFSDTDISEAFRRCPLCMLNSSDKIRKVMDYLVNRIGFEPSLVVKRPQIVYYSLEKRIVPTCIVYQALLAKDLVPKNFSLTFLLESPEKKFMRTFVEPFVAQVPGLLMMYKKSGPVWTYFIYIDVYMASSWVHSMLEPL